MDYRQLLEKLIDEYLEQYKEKQARVDQLQANKAMYENLNELLQSGHDNVVANKMIISFLITTLYSDDIYLDSFYKSITNYDSNKKSFREVRKKIYSDYNELLTELENLSLQIFRSRFMISSANRAKLSFRYNVAINDDKYDISNIKRIISYFEMSGRISPKDELMLINEIENYNRRVNINSTSVAERVYAGELYNEIPNIINAGFQSGEKIEVSRSRKPALDKFAKEIYDYIYYVDNDEIADVLASYRDFDLEDNEYNYIINEVLEYFIKDLLTLYNLLLDKDVYSVRRERNEVIKSYYDALDKYLSLKKYYDEVSTFEDEPNDVVTEEIDNSSNKIIIFSHSENTAKAKIISDMKDVPYEYYEKVKELITKFKNGTISNKEVKSIGSNKNRSEYIELKYDQIRIVIKKMKNDIYVIKGIFVKKSDNNMGMYNNFINRPTPDISTMSKLELELMIADETLRELDTLTTEKSRKGKR